MGLKAVTLKGVETIFKVLKDAVKDGSHIVETNDGWNESSETPEDVRVILDQFKQEDIEHSSFSDLIQPTDTKGLVPGVDLILPVRTSNFIEVTENEDVRRFTIVAFETDPFEAMYTMLLRDT